jgi:serine/threonine protein kinase
MDTYAEVRKLARGYRSDYRLDPKPLAPRSQAEVYGAVHKQLGVRVALKRLYWAPVDAVARMRREIEFGRLLGHCPFIMPVLDSSDSFDWFVMPIADGNAEQYVKSFTDTAALADLLAATCNGLEAAHALGWVHRDIKPTNILKLDDRWVLADWGLNRRPRGETTDPHRTKIGQEYGTPGFAPPELGDDAHEATTATDIYSIGQLIGWALTERWPTNRAPLLPPAGPWYGVVELATKEDPADRPQSVAEFRDLVLRMTGVVLDTCTTCQEGQD